MGDNRAAEVLENSMNYKLVILVTTIVAMRAAAADPDILLKGGTVYDGTGSPGVVADVLLRGDKIVAVGKVEPGPGAKVIDCKGLAVCPGFIDLHTHCDSGIVNERTKANKNYVTQGVTTVVTGNCGSGPVDAKAFYDKIDSQGAGTNVAHQVPHNSVREKVMGNSNRVPTAEELKKLEDLTRQAMKDGCWGLSTGLIYTPGTYAKTDELVALATVAANHKGHYVSHIRNEGTGLLDAIQEAITIGKQAGCPVHVSHIKASGKAAAGMSGQAVQLIESARRQGQTVTADQYPYVASSTSLKATLVSNRYRDGTEKEYVARFTDPAVAPKLRADVAKALLERDDGQLVQIARYSPNPKWQGKRIAEIAKLEGKEPLDIVVEIETHGGAQVVNFGMTEEDVSVYMRQPWVATASDGGVQSPGATVPHPRSYGTFPRKIGKYCIDDGVLKLEQAIRTSSGLPADILRFTDRGYLKKDYFADVVVLDPKAYRDTATYDKPHQYAAGVKWVFVNGKSEVADGVHRPDVLGGKALRHKQ
jgi:N-acyl-D-amino-acid deacylase